MSNTETFHPKHLSFSRIISITLPASLGIFILTVFESKDISLYLCEALEIQWLNNIIYASPFGSYNEKNYFQSLPSFKVSGLRYKYLDYLFLQKAFNN